MHEMEILHIHRSLKKLAIYDDILQSAHFVPVQCLFSRKEVLMGQVFVDVDVQFSLIVKNFLVYSVLCNYHKSQRIIIMRVIRKH